MLHNFLKQKLVLAIVILLVVGIGGSVLSHFDMTRGIFMSIGKAWEMAFGGFQGEEFAINTSLYPSSTLSGPPSQESENFSLTGSNSYPELLTDTSVAGISTDLRTALDKALIAAGLQASTSSPGDVSRSEGASSSGVFASRIFTASRICEFATEEHGDPGIILNEIAWMGSSEDSAAEWLELKNISGQSINVAGWQIVNDSGSIRIILGEDGMPTTIAHENFFVLRRHEDYSGALANAGDYLKIFDRDCGIVDELDAVAGWPAGNNISKKTLERDISANGWHTSLDVGGSPGEENSSVQPSTSSATPSASTTAVVATSTAPSTSTPAQNVPAPVTHLLIAELQITGGEGLTNQDYVRIFNPTVASVDVSGWKLRKRTKTGTEASVKVFPEGSVISPGGYFVWANSSDNFATAIGSNVSSTQTLASDNSIALFDVAEGLIDAVAWGSGHTALYIEGDAYPENPGPGEQLKRKTVGGLIRDSGNNAVDFEIKI